MAKIKHKAIYTTIYWTDKTYHKVFDYNDGVDLTQKQFDTSFIVNVPCYKVEDLTLASTGEKSNYFCFNKQAKLFNNLIRIETSNYHGKKHMYLLATPEVDEYVKQQVTFGAIKGHITKMPKKHLKVIRIHQRGRHGTKNLVVVDCYTQDKSLSDYLTKECLKA